MCSAKMTHEETDGTENVTLSQGTPLSGGINSSIQDCQKKKRKKQHQQFVSSVMRVKTDSRLFDELAHNPGRPHLLTLSACSGGCSVKLCSERDC